MIKYASIAALLFVLQATSCKKDEKFLKSFDEIPNDEYYPSEIFDQAYMSTYGTWDVYGTSGGFTGAGYTPNFEQLLMKSNGIFGIVRNDSLLSYGKIVVQNQNGQELFVQFISQSGNTNFDILSDPEKYIQLRGNDSLDLTAPCCDRYNTHLKRH